MSPIVQARRNMLERRGRAMTLRRVATPPPSVTYTDIVLTGYSRVIPADQAGAVEQGALGQLAIEIMDDELAAAGFGAPRTGDEITDALSSYGVIDARPLWDGAERAGWTILVRGGNA